MNKKITWSLFFGIVMILATLFGAYAEGNAPVKVKLHNGSFDLTDKNGNTNTFICDRSQDYTFNYPANCQVASCNYNLTCPKDIITLNATCNKECPIIPNQSISCNQECAECPEEDYSACWVGFIFLTFVIAGLVWYITYQDKKIKAQKNNQYQQPTKTNLQQTQSPPKPQQETSSGLGDLN